MASAQDYVNVTITRETPTITRAGFGSLLFIGETDDGSGGPKSGEKVKEYANQDEVLNDFDSSDPEAEASNLYFSQSIKPEKIYIGFKASGDDYSTTIDDIRIINNDWYAIAIESRTTADISDAAIKVQSLNNLLLVASDEADILDPNVSSDVATTLLDNNYSRTALMYKANAADPKFIECAWAGKLLPKNPGSVTWAYNTLSGVSADPLNKTEIGAAEDKRASYYVTIAGSDNTFAGYTSDSGGFIDITRGSDWLQIRIAEDIISELNQQDKIPYQGGSSILENIIRARLDDAVAKNIITDDYEVTVPQASEQSETDRANRLFNDVTFSATLTGAVHRVTISGIVQV